jgi:hypothetical protein
VAILSSPISFLVATNVATLLVLVDDLTSGFQLDGERNVDEISGCFMAKVSVPIPEQHDIESSA